MLSIHVYTLQSYTYIFHKGTLLYVTGLHVFTIIKLNVYTFPT